MTMWVMGVWPTDFPLHAAGVEGLQAFVLFCFFYRPLGFFQSIIVSDLHNSPDLLGRTLRLQGIRLAQHLQTNHQQVLDKPVC